MLVDDEGGSRDQASGGRSPVDLQLEWVLGKMPQKDFVMECLAPVLQPLALPTGLTVTDALDRVLRLPAVASKRYLTNKVCVCLILIHDTARLCGSTTVIIKIQELHICIPIRLISPLPSGGPVCHWSGCPATVCRPSSHPIGRRGCGRSVTVQPRGGSDCYRRTANQRPGLPRGGGSHGCGRSSDQSGVCQSHSLEGESIMKSVRKFTTPFSAET